MLDFDGVLNSYRTVWAATDNRGWMPEHLDPVSIGLVAKLCALTDAKVVISSTWRDTFSDDQLKEVLAKKGWDNAPIIGHTSTSYGYRFRGNEVGDWMTEFVRDGNEVESWVILDDIQQFHVTETARGGFYSKQPLVQTDELDGMTLYNFHDALKYLDPNHPKLKQLPYLLAKVT